jgi:hypothetical protein
VASKDRSVAWTPERFIAAGDCTYVLPLAAAPEGDLGRTPKISLVRHFSAKNYVIASEIA